MSELKPCPMTADEAISALEMCQALMLFDPMTGETHELCEENKDNQDLYNACSLAIDALRRAQSANEPLTRDCVEEAPAADVAQVVHGRWIYKGASVDGKRVYECSACHNDIYATGPYCKECGAKMEKSDV